MMSNSKRAQNVNDIQSQCRAITFSLMPSDMIQRASVCNVYESKKRAQHNHVYDPTMGITSTRNGEKCVTCAGDIRKCAGHCGSMNLAVPVLHPMYIEELVTALRYVCYRCDRCLIEHPNVPVPIYCKKCQSRQPDYTVTRDDCGVERIVAMCERDSIVLAPTDLLDKFKKVEADLKKLKLRFNPRDLIITSLVVLPTISRPSVVINGNQCDDDLSYVYIEIIKLNKKIRKMAGFDTDELNAPPPSKRSKARVQAAAAAGGAQKPVEAAPDEEAVLPAIDHKTAVECARSTAFPRTLTTDEIDALVKVSSSRSRAAKAKAPNVLTDTLVRLVGQLEMYIKTLMNNSSQMKYQNEKVIKCIKSRLNGKGGLMRGNIQGKRVDYSGRSVIGPDSYIGVDEIILPSWFVTSLTVQERVSRYNYERMCELIAQKKVAYIFRGEDQYTPRNFKLRMGDVVERHLMNGDYVCLGRQPTLHTGSMIGMRVRVLDDMPTAADLLMKPKEYAEHMKEHDYSNKTIRFNIPCCTTLNADFDGDGLFSINEPCKNQVFKN